MLEFQEGFFQQEIRNDFYVDATMKTLWAAELEVLQKVAEICDRHDIVWYAAYGTLLGAIRHEGFIPWDDDMDIWVKRRDYNRLLQILPKELPREYQIKSPMLESGYDQFHTFINNGSLSMEEEHLKQYHGCPFSVGLDIFPLDYLPRDDGERETQRNLVMLTMRSAQVASRLLHGEHNKAENPVEKKQAYIEEIEEGIRFLEENGIVKMEHQLVENEEWFKIASEFGRWANYLAMMYGEEESDYLACYIDYVRRPQKIFDKEWFAEVYSASFENFMLPVPGGYEKVLRRIYGDYNICARGGGTHEYPCYARQLRALRKMVQEKEKEKRAETLGVVSSEAILSLDADKSMPSEWETMVMRADGERKKIILCANDISVFLRYREKALNKLEEVLGIFGSLKNQITLWWRPQRTMAERLEAVSPELAGRYRAILDTYKEAGWGICDESGNIDRAVEQCDAYYGDMNAILQPFQNAGKPIMIAQVEESGCGINNEDRYKENRLYLCFTDFVVDEGKIYFSNRSFNALVIADKKTGEVEQMVPFEGESLSAREMHYRCCKWGKKVIFLPQGKHTMHIYEIESGLQRRYDLGEGFKSSFGVPWEFHVWRDKMYLLPFEKRLSLCSLNDQGNMQIESWWEMESGEHYFVHGNVDRDSFWTLEVETGNLAITNLEDHTIRHFQLPDERVFRMTYDGDSFWYIAFASADIVRWDIEQGELERYTFPVPDKSPIINVVYSGICCEEGKVFVTFENEQGIYCLNRSLQLLERVIEIPQSSAFYRKLDKRSFFTRSGEDLICTYRGMNDMVVVGLKTGEARRYSDIFKVNEKVKDYFDRVIIDCASLLMEEKGRWGVIKYLQQIIHHD